ncbi:MAG: glycosyltransferase [Lachnospiraceae bacterium]
MIPSIIHYCWFGGKDKPDEIINYINGWKSKLPKFEFYEWNESNFDVEQAPLYVQQAYEAKKYAFVSDFVRVDKLIQYGGIYLDTDVELLKRFNGLLDKQEMVLGFEMSTSINTAFIAAKKQHPFLQEFIKIYDQIPFMTDEGMDCSTINKRMTELLLEYGLTLDNQQQKLPIGIQVYPFEYFVGYDIMGSHQAVTEHTVMIHHFNGSWGEKLPILLRLKYCIKKVLVYILGIKNFDRILKKG